MNNVKSGISPKWFFQFVDAVCLLAGFVIAYRTLPILGPRFNPAFTQLYETSSAFLLILALPLWLLLLDWVGTYGDLPRVPVRVILWGMVQANIMGWALVSLIIFGTKEQGVSRLLVVLFGVVSFVLLATVRLVERQYFRMRRRAGYYSRNLLVWGLDPDVQAVQQFFQRFVSREDYCVLGLSADDALHADVGANGVVPWEAALRAYLTRHPVDEVMVVSAPETEQCLPRLIAICGEVGKPLRLVPRFALQPDLGAGSGITRYPDLLLGLPSILLARAKARTGYIFAKRLIDIVVALTLLIILAPLFVIIGLAVKLSSPGPIFYRWRVLGQNNREFTGFKFRTMVVNADQLKSKLLRYNEMSGPVFKMKNDPRVTAVGRLLRKYSLDELPQLWNVLRGDMSLVGPRPPLRYEFDRFKFWQTSKLSVKPGITCLWQVSGRNQVSNFDEWVRLDLEYIEKQSLSLDLQILAQTIVAVLRGTGQ